MLPAARRTLFPPRLPMKSDRHGAVEKHHPFRAVVPPIRSTPGRHLRREWSPEFFSRSSGNQEEEKL